MVIRVDCYSDGLFGVYYDGFVFVGLPFVICLVLLLLLVFVV